jgi:hypothetical protein
VKRNIPDESFLAVGVMLAESLGKEVEKETFRGNFLVSRRMLTLE